MLDGSAIGLRRRSGHGVDLFFVDRKPGLEAAQAPGAGLSAALSHRRAGVLAAEAGKSGRP
ncbi:hypothetical protein ASF01_14500 [Stenotrophomonas sp. Leaf70]|uniref:hypothetical protein n=1 Tax=Stenotrophomonas sp. Leaf70 TaxID=1736233 RepID=UPI0006F770CE|nr:hypothetical protein [Stenotrophomonas sp. Leaf70]KQN96564.1 hypothetical protein ASF01_14500 [Stenotrophomonas sp. Leaf70]